MITLGWKSSIEMLVVVSWVSAAPMGGSAIGPGILAPVRYTTTTILYRKQYQQSRDSVKEAPA